MNIRTFLKQVDADFNDPDVNEMLSLGYYEDSIDHYELIYDDYKELTPDVRILYIEKSLSLPVIIERSKRHNHINIAQSLPDMPNVIGIVPDCSRDLITKILYNSDIVVLSAFNTNGNYQSDEICTYLSDCMDQF